MANTSKKTAASASGAVKDSRDQLIEDLKRVIEDAQSLAEEAKDASGAAIQEKVEALQKDLNKRMKAIRKSGGDAMDELEEQTEHVEDLIRKHPWRSVGVAALAGFLADRLFLK